MRLDIWTVYWNPSDYPGVYVVRRCTVGAAGVTMHDNPTVALTLDKARAAVPAHLLRLPRSPADDPVIVEVWF